MEEQEGRVYDQVLANPNRKTAQEAQTPSMNHYQGKQHSTALPVVKNKSFRNVWKHRLVIPVTQEAEEVRV